MNLVSEFAPPYNEEKIEELMYKKDPKIFDKVRAVQVDISLTPRVESACVSNP